jgi:hypothetical protein
VKAGSLRQFAVKLAAGPLQVPGSGLPTPDPMTLPPVPPETGAAVKPPAMPQLAATKPPEPVVKVPVSPAAPAADTAAPPAHMRERFRAIGNSVGQAVKGVGDTVQRAVQPAISTATDWGRKAIPAVQDAYAATQSGFAPAWQKLKGGDIAGAWSALPEKWQNILTGVGGGAGMILLVLLLSKLFGKQANYSDSQVDEALDVMGRLSDKQRLTLYKSAMEQTAFTALRMSRPQSRTMKMRPGTQVASHKFQPGHQFQGVKQADLLPGGKADDVADSQFPAAAVAKGQAVEKEHTSTPDVAKEVAKDHLTESPRYYDSLEEMEEELKNRSKKAAAFAIRMAS